MFVNGQVRSIAYLQMIARAIKGEPIEIWGDPNVQKDMVYVKDFTQIVIKAIRTESAQGIYNVGTGIGTSLDQQVKGIVKVFSPKENPSAIVYRPEKASQAGYIYDISKTKLDLNYTPKFPYFNALEDMKAEMQGNRFSMLEKADLTI
jgi:UDP-glucose 4-epimerase